MSPDVQAILHSGGELTDRALERLLPPADTLPSSIHRAMRHSTFAGGKRLRPVLCMESARIFSIHGKLPPGIEDLAAALEMLHTYSLVHDDLPALDNDDLRRGKPTCHVVFGEAIAILCGDALQTQAYQTLAGLRCPAPATVAILGEISRATGTVEGMIGGQVMDLESEHLTPTAELVSAIHKAKTGALITTSVVTGGIYAGGDAQAVEHLRVFGQHAGLAFQIIDDVLDVTESSEHLGKTAGQRYRNGEGHLAGCVWSGSVAERCPRPDRCGVQGVGRFWRSRRPAESGRSLLGGADALESQDAVRAPRWACSANHASLLLGGSERRLFRLWLRGCHGGVIILFFQVVVENARQFRGLGAIGRSATFKENHRDQFSVRRIGIRTKPAEPRSIVRAGAGLSQDWKLFEVGEHRAPGAKLHHVGHAKAHRRKQRSDVEFALHHWVEIRDFRWSLGMLQIIQRASIGDGGNQRSQLQRSHRNTLAEGTHASDSTLGLRQNMRGIDAELLARNVIAGQFSQAKHVGVVLDARKSEPATDSLKIKIVRVRQRIRQCHVIMTAQIDRSIGGDEAFFQRGQSHR